MERLRFHLDENVDPAVADGLQRRGVDVTTCQESGLLEAPDDRQLAFAVAEGRVLITHDEDFLALAKAGVSHAGSRTVIRNCDRSVKSFPRCC